MNIKNYLIFKEVAQTENFTKAAQHLFITQSAVSHAMKELEDLVGCPLFERLHKSVRLTSNGERLLQEILPILEDFELLQSRLKDLSKQVPIRIASCITIAHTILPHFLTALRKRMPDCVVQVEVNSAVHALALLQEGKVDFAFLEGAVPHNNLLCHVFSNYAIWFVANSLYPDSMSLDEVLKKPLLLRERGSAVRETFESAMTLAGIKVYPAWNSVDSNALIEAAKAGLGIAVLPEILVAEEIQKGTLHRIEVPSLELKNPLMLLSRKENPRIELFLSLLK